MGNIIQIKTGNSQPNLKDLVESELGFDATHGKLYIGTSGSPLLLNPDMPTPASKENMGLVKIGNNITISNGIIELNSNNIVDALGYRPPETNTTYSAGKGISLSGTTFSNSGVHSVETGSSNGTISVNTNGTSKDISVKGLGSAAYTNSSAYMSANKIVTGTYVYNGSSTTSFSFMNSAISGKSFVICGTQDAGNTVARASISGSTITVYTNDPITLMRVNYICF